MKDILIRSASGVVFIALLVGSTLLSNLAIGGILAVAAFIGIQEVLNMLEGSEIECSRPAAMLSAAILFCGFGISLTANDSKYILPALSMAFLVPFIYELIASEKPRFISSIVAAAIPVYVGLPLTLLVEAANLGDYFQPYILLGIFILMWSYDTFAYLSGRFLGRNKLLERVSPKKTLEGVAGGAIMAMTTAWVYAQFNEDLSFYHWLALSLIAAVFGTLGDLTESVLKRNFSVKDSGNIMPGHGGVLDRFDALLFVGPAAYTYLLFVVN